MSVVDAVQLAKLHSSKHTGCLFLSFAWWLMSQEGIHPTVYIKQWLCSRKINTTSCSFHQGCWDIVVWLADKWPVECCHSRLRGGDNSPGCLAQLPVDWSVTCTRPTSHMGTREFWVLLGQWQKWNPWNASKRMSWRKSRYARWVCGRRGVEAPRSFFVCKIWQQADEPVTLRRRDLPLAYSHQGRRVEVI